MLGKHGEAPGARATSLRSFHHGFANHVIAKFVAAIEARLGGVKQAGVHKLSEGFIRQTPQFFTRFGAVAKGWLHRPYGGKQRISG